MCVLYLFLSAHLCLAVGWILMHLQSVFPACLCACANACIYLCVCVHVCVCVRARASVSERGWQTDGERGYAFTHRHRCNTSIYMDIHKHRCAHDYTMPQHACICRTARIRMHACMHAYAHTHTHMHTHVNAHAQTHRPAYDCTCTFPQVFEPISDQRGAGKVGGMSRRCNHVSKASPGLVQILLQVCARFSCVSVYACTYERAYVCVCVCVCVHTYIYTCVMYTCVIHHTCVKYTHR